MSLTKNEATALNICLNYDTREQQIADNYSNGGSKEFAEALGWNDKQVAALIKSLEHKGLGEGEQTENGEHIFHLSELGVRTIFDHIKHNGSN